MATNKTEVKKTTRQKKLTKKQIEELVKKCREIARKHRMQPFDRQKFYKTAI